LFPDPGKRQVRKWCHINPVLLNVAIGVLAVATAACFLLLGGSYQPDHQRPVAQTRPENRDADNDEGAAA
jgi:hypothetical protein